MFSSEVARHDSMTTPSTASYLARRQGVPRRVHTTNMSLSLTLALKDGALGTTPLSHQHPAISLLKADFPYVAAAIPRILYAFAASMTNGRREASWTELREIIIYFLLSVLEFQLLFSVCLLWPVVPGLVLLPWLSVQAASIWLLLRYLNSGRRSFTFAADRPGNSSRGDGECLDWFVVFGLVHDERVRERLPPKLVRIFGHDMHVFFPRRLGFFLDAIFVLFQRNLHMPTAGSVALYDSVRASLLKPETSGVRILAHHTGALDVSWLLARLCADFPPGDKLSKLQVFTLGAASVEMTLPLGRASYPQRGDEDPSLLYPLVTHFAFSGDPFAQAGVLLGIGKRLEGRFVGSLYTIGSAIANPARSRLLPRDCQYTFDDYIDALLPDGDPQVGVLCQVCKIDRELSEMRELAALAQSVTNERLRTRRGRLSWTALGVIANNMSRTFKDSDSMAQPLTLEEVRKKGRSLEGLRGYENNPLADAARAIQPSVGNTAQL